MADIPTTVKNKGLVERRRKQIVLAAIKLFSRNGFHKTTLKELAEEAGLSYGNIYDYVGSKEDIFFLIHEFVAGSAMEILNRSTEEVQDPIEKLRRMVRGEFNLMDQWADAVLLIYQESHILKGTFLKKLLEKERNHLQKFESVLVESIEQELLRPCNVRLVSNLIKSMIDTWTLKRWDLRGHAGQLETEGTILDVIFHGLLNDRNQSQASNATFTPLQGKVALVINGGTEIGRGICTAFFKQGARVAADTGDGRLRLVCEEGLSSDFLPPAESGRPGSGRGLSDLYALERRFGPIDFYVHDIGAGTTEPPDNLQAQGAAEVLRFHLSTAQALSGFFLSKMRERRNGKIVYIAPWLWDRHLDPIIFESVKAGCSALCRTMALEMAAASVNVNCIVPGYIRTDRPTQIEKTLKDEVSACIPAGRMGEIADVVEAVQFLMADASKYLTGQVLNVTGGR
ncbi:MAG: SDR family oxidoreductase [Desulfobacterales bacterium]|nr:SDR family oxidoreductase [Desulfobacterales bacterium]